MDVKTCKQCGELKPISRYRKYYGGRRGTYKVCLDCERINSREKYLTAKGANRTSDEEAELERIHMLYEYQRNIGLQPPVRHGGRKPLTEDLDRMIQKYADLSAKAADETPIANAASVAPYELTRWLTETLDKEPEYYLDEVYEQLKDKYRPCIGIDNDTMMPKYDNTYKDVLDRILDRFNDYEDSYYS